MISRTDRQKQGIAKWIKAGGCGILCYCTGFGKTWTTIMAIKSLLKQNSNAQILISVPTEVLKQQWTKSLVDNEVFFNCKVEIINTIVKHKWTCDLLVIDEIHGTPTNSFQAIFNNVIYTYIIGLTGTLERLDGKEKIIIKKCPVVDTVTVEEAVNNGWLAPHKEYKVLLDVDNISEYIEISGKFNNYFAYFNYDFKLAMNCATNAISRNTYAKRSGLDHKVVAAMAFDWLRYMQARKQFVTSHPKKIEIAHKILEKRQDKKCVTFSATIKDAEKIKYGATLHSKKTKKKNRITIEEFNTQMFGVLNTSKTLDVGADIPGLSVGITLSQNSSSIQKNQRKGRVIRFEEGKEAEMFTLVIKGTVDETWYDNATNSNYITIDEDQLDQVLNYEPIEFRERSPIKNMTYRF